jgi:hypothetical protein
MKYCIIITGQLRTWKFSRYFIKNLQEKYDCDIFLGLDLNNNNQLLHKNTKDSNKDEEIQEAIDFYKPVLYHINDINDEKEITSNINKINNTNKIYKVVTKDTNELISDYLLSSNKINTNHPTIINNCKYTKNSEYIELLGFSNKAHCNGILRQYHILKKTYELVINYSKTYCVNYDIIIRIRPDFFIWDESFHISHFNKLQFNEQICQELCNPYCNVKYNVNNIELIKNIYKNININFIKPNTNTIFIIDGGIVNYQDLNNFTYVNDFFWYHGEDLLNVLTCFYDDLPDIINECLNTFWPISYGMEHYFSVFLQKRKILLQKSNINYYTCVREL